MTKEEIQQIYDYSKSKGEICKKLNIRINQNGLNIDKDILECFLQIGIESKEQISKKNLSNHWLEIQKRDYELNPKYCEDGFLEEVMDFSIGMIKNPNITDGKFDETKVNIKDLPKYVQEHSYRSSGNTPSLSIFPFKNSLRIL